MVRSSASAKTIACYIFELDICVQRTRMPPSSALSKMALWLRYWLLSDNYMSIKTDLYKTEETKEGPCSS